MIENCELYLDLIAEDKLFLFNSSTGNYRESNISQGSRGANGYGDFYQIDGKKELVCIYGSDSTLFFYFRKPYRLDTFGLVAKTKSEGFCKTRFILQKNDNILIDIVYKVIDAESDIFLDVVSRLKIKPHNRLVDQLQQMSEFYLETDLQKRMNFRLKEEPLSFMQRLKELFQ